MEALVLNVNYHPISRISTLRALHMIARGRAETVTPYEGRTARPGTKLPAVIRLTHPFERKPIAVKFSRESIFARDRGACQYCGERVDLREFTYDHVLPRSRGGKTTWENVVTCCYSCNSRKGGRTPAQAGMTLRSTPVKPKKVPELYRPILPRKSDPAEWTPWIGYWTVELEHDNGR